MEIVRHQLRNPATIAASASYLSNAFPIKHARLIVIRFKSTDNPGPGTGISAVGFQAGFAGTPLYASGNAILAPFLTTTPIGAITGQRLDSVNGLPIVLTPPTANAHMNRFMIEIMAATCTCGANGLAGFEVWAEVFYEEGEVPTGLTGTVVAN